MAFKMHKEWNKKLVIENLDQLDTEQENRLIESLLEQNLEFKIIKEDVTVRSR